MPDDNLNPNPTPTPAPTPDWREPYKANADLAPVMDRLAEFKTPEDAFKSLDWHKSQLGKAVFLKDPKNAEERKQAQARAYELGIFDRPNVPESPDKYDIKLDSIPEALRADTTVKAVREWAHKNHVSVEALNELIGIETARYEGAVKPLLAQDREASKKAFDEWAGKTGKAAQELEAYGGAWLAKNLSEQELQVLESAGLADHPALLKLVAQAGMDSGEDISVSFESSTEMSADAKEASKAANEIILNPENPKYKLYHANDPTVQREVAELFKKAFPGEVQM